MRCVECGQSAPLLYKEYSKGNIRLSVCSACNGTVDKYVEFENLLIFVDLMLFRTPAYRHILYNRAAMTLRQVVKLFFVLCLLDMNMKAYLVEQDEFVILAGIQASAYRNVIINVNSMPDVPVMDLIYMAFGVFVLAGMESVVFMMALLLMLGVHPKWKIALHQQGATKLIGMMLVASWGKACIMLSIIWNYYWTIVPVLNLVVLRSNYIALSLYLVDDSINILILLMFAIACRMFFQTIVYWLMGEHGVVFLSFV